MSSDLLANSLTLIWILLCGFLVLFMQAGFALVTVGFARARHAGHVAMLNLVAFIVTTIAYFLVGFAIQYGGSHAVFAGTSLEHLGGISALSHEFGGRNFGIAGARAFCLAGAGPGVLALFFFQLMFLQTAVYIPVGSAMERIRISAFILIAAFMGAIVYPLFANWVWGGGFLSATGRTLGLGHGYVDFAGSTVVHATGGYAGLALALALRPRLGKFNRDNRPIAMPGHNIPLVVVGVFVLLFGWMGFNCGSTLSAMDTNIARIAINTVLSASSASLAALGLIWRKFGKPDIGIACSGLLSGAVAITAPCAYVEPGVAVIIGIVAGALVVASIAALEWRGGVDDPASAISIHGVCGTWGALSVGLFADGTRGLGLNGVPGCVRGLFYGDPWQLAAQLLGTAVNFVFAFGAVYLFCQALSKVMPIRPTGRQESDGLDMGECGSPSYPDFTSGSLTSVGLRM